MKNFKEIAEKVLNGELKGTFVLKNGCTRDSRLLARNKNGLTESFPYYLVDCGSLTNEGRGYETIECEYDVVDFIEDGEDDFARMFASSMFDGQIEVTGGEHSDAHFVIKSISDNVSKVRTETILGHKYITGLICHDGSEISLKGEYRLRGGIA